MIIMESLRIFVPSRPRACFDNAPMKLQLKPIEEQVAVVMGASSGIGRATALLMAQKGARVVVSARRQEALDELVQEIERAGGQALAVAADVTDFDQINGVARAAISKWGHIDTWIHTAAAAMYARFEDTSPEEFKRVIEVTQVGAAWGAMVALPHLKKSHGALIQVSSIEALVGIPYQAAYGSAKHGMKAYLDVLRIELHHDQIPVSVTNIMPSGINTPFFTNARTKIGVKPVAVPPMYQPEIVAKAIATAAVKPIPEIIIGGGGVMFALLKRLSPHFVDLTLRKTSFSMQKTDEPKSSAAPDNLFSSDTGDTRVQGDFSGARGTSLGTWLECHPSLRTALGWGAALGALALVLRKK